MRGKESAQISANPDWINQILLHTKRMIQSNAISSKCKDLMIELSKYAFHLLSHACQGSLTSGFLWLSLGTPFIKVESANRCGDFVVKDWHNLPTKLVLNKQRPELQLFFKETEGSMQNCSMQCLLEGLLPEKSNRSVFSWSQPLSSQSHWLHGPYGSFHQEQSFVEIVAS